LATQQSCGIVASPVLLLGCKYVMQVLAAHLNTGLASFVGICVADKAGPSSGRFLDSQLLSVAQSQDAMLTMLALG